TLGFTVGTWALDFVATGRGGWLQQLASYTPTAALRTFEQGLLRLSTVVVMLTLSVGGFGLAALWLHSGRPLVRKLVATLGLILALASLCFVESKLTSSWDVSENK